jgi:hypothetical protein
MSHSKPLTRVACGPQVEVVTHALNGDAHIKHYCTQYIVIRTLGYNG